MAELSGVGYIGRGACPPPMQYDNATKAVRSSELVNISERNSKNIQQLSELTIRLRTLRDRLLGGRPEKDQARATPSGAGLLNSIGNQAGDTSTILEILNDVVSDLEGL